MKGIIFLTRSVIEILLRCLLSNNWAADGKQAHICSGKTIYVSCSLCYQKQGLRTLLLIERNLQCYFHFVDRKFWDKSVANVFLVSNTESKNYLALIDGMEHHTFFLRHTFFLHDFLVLHTFQRFVSTTSTSVFVSSTRF